MIDDDHTAAPPSEPVAGGPDQVTTSTLARCLAVLSAVAAVIHFAVANTHYQEYWAFGAFMIAAAVLQSAWIAGVLSTTKWWLWVSGAVLNLGIVVVYVVTRTVGDVVGPTPHEVEPVGFGDAACTGIEAAIAIGCVVLLLGRPITRVRPRVGGYVVAATGTTMAALLIVALLDGGPEMSMSMDDGPVAQSAAVDQSAQPAATAHHPGQMSMKMATPHGSGSIHLRTSSPAGAVTMPTAMQMMPGMAMATGPCTTPPTAAQQSATVRLVDTSWRAAQRYRSLAKAKADGYVPITPTGRSVVHYLNLASYEATSRGGPVITPTRPESLVYANTRKGAVLAATMYLSRPGTTTPPQPGGCLTAWHIHTNLCYGSLGTIVGLTHSDGSCSPGSVHRVTPPMMHVWYVPIPGGPTAVDAPDSQIVRAAEKVASPHNSMA